MPFSCPVLKGASVQVTRPAWYREKAHEFLRRNAKMSEAIKIQTSSPDELAGGQTPLSPDQEQKSRSGFTGSQVFPLSGRTGTNVEGRAASLCSPAGNNRDPRFVAGMACDSPVAPTIKPVDRLTIEGSTPGDFRATAAPAVLPNQPGPREAKGQTPLSGRTPAPSAPQSFDGENVGN